MLLRIRKGSARKFNNELDGSQRCEDLLIPTKERVGENAKLFLNEVLQGSKCSFLDESPSKNVKTEGQEGKFTFNSCTL